MWTSGVPLLLVLCSSVRPLYSFGPLKDFSCTGSMRITPPGEGGDFCFVYKRPAPVCSHPSKAIYLPDKTRSNQSAQELSKPNRKLLANEAKMYDEPSAQSLTTHVTTHPPPVLTHPEFNSSFNSTEPQAGHAGRGSAGCGAEFGCAEHPPPVGF